MFKLLVLSCLLAACCSSPLGLGIESWLRDLMWRIHGRGCADLDAGWMACVGAEPDSLVPHPRDCRFFFYCVGPGVLPACRPCPAGLYYNPALQVCDWPNQANCTARPPPPVGNETDTWLPGIVPTELPRTSTDLPSTNASSTEESSPDTDAPQ